MVILLVHPGASMSTADVHTGLKRALQVRGHTVWDYALDQRIERAGAYLSWCWRRASKRDPTLERPRSPDIIYRAGEELVARALRVMPDVVLVVSAMYLHPDIFELLRRACLRVALLYTESPYNDLAQWRLLPWLDVAWTTERLSAAEAGIHYLRHAWDPEVHRADAPVPDDVPAHDVLFVGTGFAERIETLSAVDWDGVDLALYGQWDLLGSRNRLRRHIRGGYVSNARAAQLYRRAKVGLNLYRRSTGFSPDTPRIEAAESLNPRAYELAATGCFSISDYRAEVGEMFGTLVPTFSEPAEVRPLLDRWLADDAGRARIQRALPAAVAAHTWDQRAEQIEEDLRGVGIGAGRAQAIRAPAADHPLAASAGG